MNRSTRRPAAVANATKPNPNTKLVKYLTPEAIEALIQCCATHGRHGVRDVALVTMMFNHGLRVSEAISLQWSAVDIKTKMITLRRLKGGKPSVQPLYPSDVKALKALSNPKTGAIFLSHYGAPLTAHAVNALLARRGPQAGVGHVFPHMLRHSCGFKLTNDGVELNLIADHLGHQSIMSTMRYAQVAPSRHNGLFK